MRQPNVDHMLACMTWEQFLEWKAYDEVEPFEQERADYRSAQIAQALWNIARDTKKNPNGWPLTDFVLAFGDAPRILVKQSVQQQEFLIDAWIAGSNAVFEAKSKCQPTSA